MKIQGYFRDIRIVPVYNELDESMEYLIKANFAVDDFCCTYNSAEQIKETLENTNHIFIEEEKTYEKEKGSKT